MDPEQFLAWFTPRTKSGAETSEEVRGVERLILATDPAKWAEICRRMTPVSAARVRKALRPASVVPEGFDPDDPITKEWLSGILELNLDRLPRHARALVKAQFFAVVAVVTRIDNES